MKPKHDPEIRRLWREASKRYQDKKKEELKIKEAEACKHTAPLTCTTPQGEIDA
jgi:hypothetical protein